MVEVGGLGKPALFSRSSQYLKGSGVGGSNESWLLIACSSARPREFSFWIGAVSSKGSSCGKSEK